jgi:hypothetical protein
VMLTNLTITQILFNAAILAVRMGATGIIKGVRLDVMIKERAAVTAVIVLATMEKLLKAVRPIAEA